MWQIWVITLMMVFNLCAGIYYYARDEPVQVTGFSLIWNVLWYLFILWTIALAFQ